MLFCYSFTQCEGSANTGLFRAGKVSYHKLNWYLRTHILNSLVPQVIVLNYVFIIRSIHHNQVISLSFITTKCFPSKVKFTTDFKFDKVPVRCFWCFGLHRSSPIQLICVYVWVFFLLRFCLRFCFCLLTSSCQTRHQEVKANFCWNAWRLSPILSFLHSASKWYIYLKGLEIKYVEFEESESSYTYLIPLAT